MGSTLEDEVLLWVVQWGKAAVGTWVKISVNRIDQFSRDHVMFVYYGVCDFKWVPCKTLDQTDLPSPVASPVPTDASIDAKVRRD